MRSTAALLAPALALLAIAAACDGDDADPTPTAAPTDAAPASEIDVPPRPAAFADYPDAVATYLSDAGDAAVATCLAGLLDVWAMPDGREPLPGDPPPAGERCLAGNVDQDPEDEIAVRFTAEPDDPAYAGLLSNVAVFDQADGAYRVAYQTWTADELPEGAHASPFPHTVASAGDINADGNGELVYTTSTCGAHTCSLTVFVLTGTPDAYRHLTPESPDPANPYGIAMETADLSVEDRDGDGAQEIVLHGGTINSVGAGPQRTRTEVYAWDGAVYALTELLYDPSDLRLFRVLDADEAFAAARYDEAATLYNEAIVDTTLADAENFGSRDELLAYAHFRLGLSHLQLGDTAGASQAVETAISRFPTTLIAGAAVAFRDAIDLSQVRAGELSAGCVAAAASLASATTRFEEAWYYGYSNPQLTPTDVCPF